MSRVRPRRPTPRRRDAPRAGDGDPEEAAGWWEWANHLLAVRSGGYCEKCGEPLGTGRLERHHRQRRREGGDRLSNLLLLHAECHRWITEHPATAAANGWIVPAGWDLDLKPVLLPRLGFRTLLDDGGTMEAVWE